MKRLLGITLAAAVFCGFGPDLGISQAGAEPVKMRVSHQLPPRHHMAKLIEAWAADVEQMSNGAVDVQTFPANQAFGAKENFPAVARGKIEAALSVNFQWGKTIPEMNVTAMPYTFTDLEVLGRFPGSKVAKFLEQKLESKGVRNIAWLFVTNTSIYTSGDKPLIKPADFKGIKIRGLNKLVDSGLRALGAAPSAMSGSKVYQALQTGVIDAGLTDVSAAYSRKYYEVQKFGTVSKLFSVYFHLYVNPKWWDGLDAAAREAISKASAKAEKSAMRRTKDSAAAAPDQLRGKGMNIHIHSEAEAEVMRKVMIGPFTDAFLEASGDDGKKILELIKGL